MVKSIISAATSAWRTTHTHTHIFRPSTARSYAKLNENALRRELAKANRRASNEPSLSHMQKTANAARFKYGIRPLYPGTFVALPLFKSPRSLMYHWYRLRHALFGFLSVLELKLKSMPTWTTRPQWKSRRAQIGPTAQVLHREMLEAFAAGDKAALHTLCLSPFARKLCAIIDRRGPLEGQRFQVLKYNQTWLYPRLMSRQIHQDNPYDKVTAREQAVVAVASTQQASKFRAATGQTMPGSVKEQDKLEYVVLSREVNTRTFEMTPWQVWGTTSATTLEMYLKETAALEMARAKRVGWSERPPV